jgi:hypothetical protein
MSETAGAPRDPESVVRRDALPAESDEFWSS